MSENYQVIEDNAGNMFLFFFEGDQVVLGLEHIEYAQPGDLDNITLDEARTWEGEIDDPRPIYDNITSYEFGWKVVADQDGVYPDGMGRAAQTVYGIEAK